MKKQILAIASAAVLAAGAWAMADSPDAAVKTASGSICIPANSLVTEVKTKPIINEQRNIFLYAELPQEDIYHYLEVDVWSPAEEDVLALSRMAWGEARGCGERGIEAVMWCAMNRLDIGRWGDTVLKVVSARAQFYGYNAGNPVTEEIRAIAERVLTAHHNGEEGIIPSDYIYFHGDGRENIFRNERGEKVRV